MNDFEQIQAYLNNELDATARHEFIEKLNNDPAFKANFDRYNELSAIIQKHHIANENINTLNKTLTPLTQQYFGKQNTMPATAKVVSFKKYLFMITAAAAVLLLVFLLPGGGIDDYKVNPMPGTIVRGIENPEKKGAQLFNNKNYAAALPLLKEKAAVEPNNPTAQYYYGVCLVQTKNYKEALPIFESLLSGHSAFKEDAAFYGALSAFYIGDKAKARSLAQKVPSTSAYYKNAKKIIKKSS